MCTFFDMLHPGVALCIVLSITNVSSYHYKVQAWITAITEHSSFMVAYELPSESHYDTRRYMNQFI